MTAFRLGRRGLAVSAVALGALGLTGAKLLREPDDPYLKSHFPEGFRNNEMTEFISCFQ